MKKQKSVFIDVVFAALCVALMIFGGASIFIIPAKSFSEQENRALAPYPHISLSSLADGSFFGELSSFCSDHAPYREQMISLRTRCELLLGKKQNNGVIFSRDGALTDRAEYDDTSLLYKNLSAVGAFTDHAEAELIIVPRSVDVRFSELESTSRISPLCDQALLARLRELNSSGNDPYYKTDHHLNATGILALYDRLSISLGYTPLSVRRQTVSSSFYGSIYSKAGLLDTGSDALTLLRYEGDESIRVDCFDEGCGVCSLYDFENLEVKDKYCVFLGGNHGLIRVSSDAQKPKLLIIKDSFANALIPLLARHFDLTVVDPRYYSESIYSLFESEDFDRVLLLFGADTLATTGIAKSFTQ